MRGTFRYFAFLTLSIWLGSIVFFAFVEAPAVFNTLPSRYLAGQIVALSLTRLHGIAIVCGLLLIGWLLLLGAEGRRKALIANLSLASIMLALTLASQFVVIPRMEANRIHAGGDITAIPHDNPDYIAFNRLHHISEHLEEAILIGALVLLGLMVHRPARSNS